MAKYKKVIDWINKNLDNGTLKPGSRIPSENELCAKFGLSRQTVRHAERPAVKKRSGAHFPSSTASRRTKPRILPGVITKKKM